MWKILVADDEVACLTMVVEMLKEKANCTTVTNGKDLMSAYTKAKSEGKGFDIILLDVAMPDMDGLTILRKIRRSEEKDGVLFGDGIHIIMVTGFKENFLDAFNRGCDDYIVKPFTREVLIAKIEEKLKRGKSKERSNPTEENG